MFRFIRSSFRAMVWVVRYNSGIIPARVRPFSVVWVSESAFKVVVDSGSVRIGIFAGEAAGIVSVAAIAAGSLVLHGPFN